MPQPTDNSPGEDAQAGEPLEKASEQRVLDLMDELYEFEQFRQEQLTLRRFSSYLKSSLTRREAYAVIECFGPQLWPGATGAVYFLHATEEYLERVASWGDASLNQSSLALHDCWAMRRAQPHCVRDASIDLPCAHIAQVSGVLPCLCVPLIAHGQMLGLLHLQRLTKISKTLESGMSTDPGVVLAVMVSEDLSFALANMSLRESLHEQSIRDPLTGLYNRRFVDEFLVRELARAIRKTRQLSVVVLDIDHFKHINDTFGHSAGDMVLRQVSHILQAHVRESDIACRLGGEEFSLLLAELSSPIAVQRAEDIRKALREMSLTYENKPVGPITASFGAATYPEHGRTVEALFRAADEALYDAKRAGRDRVVSARSPA
jgi:diguanylate cyclase (GGDEF)-like protein